MISLRVSMTNRWSSNFVIGQPTITQVFAFFILSLLLTYYLLFPSPNPPQFTLTVKVLMIWQTQPLTGPDTALPWL